MAQIDRFASRWGLILAALGMAIGTGNIWRFPRVMAANGGGSFLIPWLIFLFTWSIPLLVVESAMGKKARRGTVGPADGKRPVTTRFTHSANQVRKVGCVFDLLMNPLRGGCFQS